MAKKKTESVLSRETKKRAEVDVAAKEAERVASEEAAEAVREAEKAAKRIVTPKAPRPKKVKKTRFVREVKEKTPRAEAAKLPERSANRSGKMMSKNVKMPLKEKPEPGHGPAR